MKINLSLLTALIGVLITGCTSLPPTEKDKSVSIPKIITESPTAVDLGALATSSKKSFQLTLDEQAKIQTQIDNMLNYCQPILTKLEKDSAKGSNRSFWLSVVGLVSGSLISPTLAAGNAAKYAGAIAGFSSLGGATNLASESLKNNGLSGSSAANDRNEIITRIREKLAIVVDGNKEASERLNAITTAKAECTLYKITVPTNGQKS
jgi:hypothetical protein